jgi:YkoY family integral membrane protein
LIHVQIEDLAVIGTLVLLEGLLSADNALVLALLVRHLPKKQQHSALLYGLVGAFVLRGIGIVVARFIINLWWLCGIGAGYLIWLCAKHFIAKSKEDEHAVAPTGPGFWQTVIIVELTDIVFAVDSILVAVALSNKLWVIYAGAFLGIVLLRLAAGFFIRLIRKYPALDNMAYALVGWAGVKLAAKAVELYLVASERFTPETVPHLMPPILFWPVLAVIAAIGTWTALHHKPTAEDLAEQRRADQALECLEDRDPRGDEKPGENAA